MVAKPYLDLNGQTRCRLHSLRAELRECRAAGIPTSFGILHVRLVLRARAGMLVS